MNKHLPVLVAVLVLIAGGSATGASSSAPAPTPGIACDRGSLPEKLQGRAPSTDVASGRYAKGYRCNAIEVSHYGSTGGYRVERYVDKAGHECAFWDTTLLHPAFVGQQLTGEAVGPNAGPGTWVMDMHDPAHPVHTDTLRTAAFQTPHESVRVNQKRGLIVADMGNPVAHPGFVDVFDISKDCRHPALLSTTPLGVLGHEGGFAPDGLTYYVASLYGHTLAAIDLSNPRAPSILWLSFDYQPHGVSLSNDGNTLYMAESINSGTTGYRGLTVLDVSQVQNRVLNPTVPVISRLTWPNVGTPQNATPFTEHGHPYLLEIDEFGSGDHIGAGRIIDIASIKKPKVIANLRLAVNQPKAQGPALEGDPGNTLPEQTFQGYQGHYCSLPSRIDPQVIACAFIMSGLRVFDISTITKPKEIAYFNKPAAPGSDPLQPRKSGAFAMSAPAYDQATGDIWYSDGNSGFYVVRLTGAAKRRYFAKTVFLPGN
ncbi:MAG: hypothetical protein JWN31_524 [Frankiales bacterium]|nr:hypothetical protein [Frankiales bacterium]